MQPPSSAVAGHSHCNQSVTLAGAAPTPVGAALTGMLTLPLRGMAVGAQQLPSSNRAVQDWLSEGSEGSEGSARSESERQRVGRWGQPHR